MSTHDAPQVGDVQAAFQLIRLLGSVGSKLGEQAEIACAQRTWAVLVGEAAQFELLKAPLQVVLSLLELEPGQALAVALPIDVLVDALELVDSTDELASQLRQVPPSDCCPCLVAVQHELVLIHLPRDGLVPALWVQPAIPACADDEGTST